MPGLLTAQSEAKRLRDSAESATGIALAALNAEKAKVAGLEKAV